MSAMMKSLARHNTSSGRQDYLEGGGAFVKEQGRDAYLREKAPKRYLERDFLNVPDHRKGDWGAYMDETRSIFGNDRDWGGRHAVTYQEFVLSPDPEDDVSLGDMRELACSWADEWFGAGGRLGAYQVAIIYHDDNSERIERGEDGILHAHVHVCNTELESGHRLQINRRDNRALTDTLQRMCKERGLSFFSKTDADVWEDMQLSKARRSKDKVEASIIGRGSFSWKEDLRGYVECAMRTTRTDEDFRGILSDWGVGVEDAGEDYIFSHPSDDGSKHYRCYGSTLGAAYTKQTVRLYHDRALRGRQDRAPRDYPASVRDQIRAYVARSAGARRVRADAPPFDVADVALCLKVNDLFGICCMEHYDMQLDYIDGRIAANRSEKARASLEAARDHIAKAREVALSGDFFDGASPEGPYQPGIRPRPKRVKKRKGATDADGGSGGDARARLQQRTPERRTGPKR